MSRNLKQLEEHIGYQFHDFELLRHAMMHSSYTNEKHLKKYQCNERLEFLGDAVLELISSEYLFLNYETKSEGEMTKTRASMVCEPALAFCAREIELGSYLLLGKGEEAAGGRRRDSVTSDALEALIGAIYLDGGFASAKEFIHRFVLSDLENKLLFFMIARLSYRRWYRPSMRKLCPMCLSKKRDRITIRRSRQPSTLETSVMDRELEERKKHRNSPQRTVRFVR